MHDEPADLAPNAAPPNRPLRGHAAANIMWSAAAPVGGAALFGAIRRHRLPLAGCVVLVPLLALLALHQVTPLYTADGTVFYEDRGYAAHELQSVLRVDPMSDAVMASQAEIVRGLSIAERLADRLGLYDDPEFNVALRPPGMVARVLAAARGALAPWLTPPVSDETEPRRRTLLAVQNAITVTTAKASRVLNVSFTARDPEQAATAADLVMQLYIQDQFATKAAAVDRATAWLDKRVDELRGEVARTEGRIAAYRAMHGLAQGVHAGLDTERISRLNDDLLNARTELAAAQGRLDSLRGQPGRGETGAAAQAAVAQSVVQARAQRDLIAGRLEALAAREGPRNPELVGLRRNLAAADRAVAAEVAHTVAAAGAELRADQSRVAQLEDALQQAQAEQDRSNAEQVALNTMQRDADAARNLLLSVQEGAEQTARQTAIEMPEARVISRALAPTEPSFPRRGLLLAAAVVFGIMSGLLLVHLLELSDTTFRSGDDVRGRLGLRCLALIPAVRRRALGRGRLLDYALDKPLSPFAEQVRALRAGLWLERVRPRIVAFTAARPSEGKTTVTLALGRCAALCGERVVVIDCDVRQPSLGRLMDMDDGDGLIDCLLGRATLAEVIRRDPASGLSVIPAGRLTVNTMSLFMSGTMATLLQQLRQDYDLILLDAPPAHAMTDARVIAGLAEATVLCLRWRSTPLCVVRDAIGLLEEVQASVVGVALTRVDVRAHLRSGAADAEVYHPRYGGYFRE